MSPSFLVLLITSFVSTMASGLFWTGFPVFLNDFGRSSLDLSQIYAFATLGSLVFGLIGGIWSDLGSCKKISVVSQLLSAVAVVGIFLGWDFFGPRALMYALPVLYFNFAVAGIAEMVWVLNFGAHNEIKSKILDRAIITFLAKLIGFSAGPVLFNFAGSSALLVCAALFAVTALIQSFLKDAEKSVGEVGVKVSLTAIKALIKSPAFVAATVLTGMLSIPVNPLFVTRMLELGGPADASWFWGLAGTAGFANLLIRRLFPELKFSRGLAYAATAVLVVCVALAFSTGSKNLVLGFSSLFVFGSVLFSLQLYLRVGEESVRNSLGGSFGLLNMLLDLGVFIGMVLGSAGHGLSPLWTIGVLIAALVARSLAFSRFC